MPPPPPPPPPRRAPRPQADPVAAVLGNATMLGIGYMIMRRPILTAVALTGTGFLLWSAAVQTENPLWRILLPLWGLAMILHAGWLTRRADRHRLVDLREPNPAWRGRIFTLTAVALVLLTVSWFRLDGWWTVHDAETAHSEGDCESATTALESLDAVNRVANGPATLRGAEELEACELLLAAFAEPSTEAAEAIEEYMAHPGALWDGAGPKRAEFLLDAALDGERPDTADLEEAFAQLTETLEELPGQSGAVRATAEGFMADLTEAPACMASQVDEWLASQELERPELSEPVAAASDQIPVRLLECALDRLESGENSDAGTLFNRFLTEYPDHERAGDAADGYLETGRYCGDPVAYQGAPEYSGEGPHAMQTFGIDPDWYDFPGSWRAETADGTVLVLCVDGPQIGEYQDTCPYQWGDGGIGWVTFYAHRFDIKAYELQSGELVADYSREIGEPCPNRLDGEYRTVYLSVSGDFMSMASEFTNAEAREMFYPLMD